MSEIKKKYLTAPCLGCMLFAFEFVCCLCLSCMLFQDRLVLFKRTMSEIKLMRKEDCAAIQPDLAARDYSSKSEEQIIDTTFVHTTCSSYAEAQRKELEDTTVAGFLLHDEWWCPSGCIDNTPAFVNRAGEKHTKYGSIEYLANLQAAVKKSSKSVKFVPAVMTHRG